MSQQDYDNAVQRLHRAGMADRVRDLTGRIAAVERAILVEFARRFDLVDGALSPDTLALAEKLATGDVVVTLIKGADHRLSREEDIARLIAAVADIA